MGSFTSLNQLIEEIYNILFNKNINCDKGHSFTHGDKHTCIIKNQKNIDTFSTIKNLPQNGFNIEVQYANRAYIVAIYIGGKLHITLAYVKMTDNRHITTLGKYIDDSLKDFTNKTFNINFNFKKNKTNSQLYQVKFTNIICSGNNSSNNNISNNGTSSSSVCYQADCSKQCSNGRKYCSRNCGRRCHTNSCVNVRHHFGNNNYSLFCSECYNNNNNSGNNYNSGYNNSGYNNSSNYNFGNSNNNYNTICARDGCTDSATPGFPHCSKICALICQCSTYNCTNDRYKKPNGDYSPICSSCYHNNKHSNNNNQSNCFLPFINMYQQPTNNNNNNKK